MPKLRLLRLKTVQQLSDDIKANLEKYRSGNFSYLDVNPEHYFESQHEFDDEALAKVNCELDNHKEVECCAAIFEAMGEIPPYLARDNRIWVHLTHTALLPYARKRWPIPEDDDKAVAHIRTHFFATGARGIERDNAASRLWWMASLCHRVEGLTMMEALTVFLYHTDVRANIIERPTTAQSVPVFSAIIKRLNASYKTEKKELFERAKFRNVMKGLNLRGGVKLLGLLDEDQVGAIVDECAM